MECPHTRTFLPVPPSPLSPVVALVFDVVFLLSSLPHHPLPVCIVLAALGELCLTACPNIRPPTIARLILCCRRLSVFKVELYFPSEGGQGGEDRGQRIRLIDGVPNAVATLQSLLPPEDPTMRALIAAAGTGRVSGRRHRL
jgi:hypothetical protein